MESRDYFRAALVESLPHPDKTQKEIAAEADVGEKQLSEYKKGKKHLERAPENGSPPRSVKIMSTC